MTLMWRLGDRRVASIVPTYQQIHIQYLTAFHRITVGSCSSVFSAQASTVQRRILIPEIVDDRSYCAALHELGHIICPTQLPISQIEYWAQSRHIYSNEIGAWRWAKEHALWWTPEMEDTKRYALSTYGIEDMQRLWA